MGCHVAGKYVYIETSFPSSLGDRAQLKSRVIDPSCKPCSFNFWYSMFGSTINTLSVSLQPVNGNKSQTIWTLSGNQGSGWKNAVVSLVSSVPYRLIIEAVAGSSYTGDIALDDLSLTNCPPIPRPSPPPPCASGIDINTVLIE